MNDILAQRVQVVGGHHLVQCELHIRPLLSELLNELRKRPKKMRTCQPYLHTPLQPGGDTMDMAARLVDAGQYGLGKA